MPSVLCSPVKFAALLFYEKFNRAVGLFLFENRVLPRNAGSSMGQIRDIWFCPENIAAGVMEG